LDKLILELVKKHDTRNPIQIAKGKSIIVLFEELGTINGYYNTAYRQKFIHINSNLTEHEQIFTAAHELGHALLHPKANTPFLRASTYISVNKLEIEANKFAVNLLISDEDLDEFREYPLGHLSKVFGCHERLIELRLANSL